MLSDGDRAAAAAKVGTGGAEAPPAEVGQTTLTFADAWLPYCHIE
jgi:hypothetical protein